MPDMFFPDEEELMRQQMMMQQPMMDFTQPGMMEPPSSPISQGMAPVQREQIDSPDLLKQVLQLMSNPLAAQVKRPKANEMVGQYGPQIKDLQSQMGMQEVSPEQRDKINRGLSLQAYFADDNRRLSGQPSEQYALQKAIAQQQLNPGTENLEKTTKLLEVLKGLKSVEGANKDNTLKDLMASEQIKALGEKNNLAAAQKDENSELSKEARESFKDDVGSMATRAKISKHYSINNLAPDLEKFMSMADGKNYNQIQELVKRVDKAKAEADKEAGYDVNKELGLFRTDLLGSGLKLKQGEDEQKRLDELRKVSIPGFDFFDVKNVVPDPQSAKAMRVAASTAAKMQSTLRKMEKLVDEKGLSQQSLIGVGKDLDQYYQDLLVQTKELDRLGALSGSDMRIEQGKIPNPTSFAGSVEGKNKFKERVGSFSNIVLDSVKQMAPLMGYRPREDLLSSISAGDLSSLERAKTPITNPGIKDETKKAENKVNAQKLKIYADKYKLSPEKAAALLKEKGYNVEGY